MLFPRTRGKTKAPVDEAAGLMSNGYEIELSGHVSFVRDLMTTEITIIPMPMRSTMDTTLI